MAQLPKSPVYECWEKVVIDFVVQEPERLKVTSKQPNQGRTSFGESKGYPTTPDRVAHSCGWPL